MDYRDSKEDGTMDSLRENYFQILRENKKKRIYNLIEESLNKGFKKVISKYVVPSKKCDQKKSEKYFQGRNTVKKVKIYCLKIFKQLLKHCFEADYYKLKQLKPDDEQEPLMYIIFKSDISKYRNKLLLEQPMKTIIQTFCNLNLENLEKVKHEKKSFFYFLINSKWRDFISYIRMETQEIFEFSSRKNINSILRREEIDQYLNYIESGSNILKKRINVNSNYLKLYEKFIHPLINKNNSFSLDDLLFEKHFEEYLRNPSI
jgi:hypothetical protein